MKSRALLLVACAASLVAACSLLVDTTDLSGGPTVDAGTAGDAPIETGTTVVDAASDAGPDVSADASLDSALDAAPKPCGLGDPFEGPPQLISELDDTSNDKGGRVTPDGNWLLFSRKNANPNDKWQIVISRWNAETSRWGPPRPLDALNESSADGGALLSASADPNYVPAPGGTGGRIFFASDRLVDGFFSSTDIYYANVKDNDFTNISPPTRLGTMPNGALLSGGGLEGWLYVVPTGAGAGRLFFGRYVAVNHIDMFSTDFDSNLTFSPPLPLSDLNLPDQSQEYKPAFGNGVIYFTSSRVLLADGGLQQFPPDASAGFPDGGYVSVASDVWAATQKAVPGPPRFDAPVRIPELNKTALATEITSVSPDGCSLILAANWPGGTGPAGTFHLYKVRRKRPL